MRLFFSPEYSGTTYVGLESTGLLFDGAVVDEQGMINLLQLHAGIHSDHAPFVKRLALYYNAFSQYMAACPQNALAASFQVAGLGTAKACLVWREALVLAGWDFQPGVSPRLDVLAGVEHYYKGDGQADQLRVLCGVAEKRALLPAGSEVVLPCGLDLLHPMWARLFRGLQAQGVSLSYSSPALGTGNNLGAVRDWLTGAKAGVPSLNEADESLRVLRFSTQDKALAYLTGLDADAYTVWLNEGNKKFDNWLRMAGQPVAGSVMPNSNPQIVQLFTLGLSLFSYPTNIHTLIQWLVAPIQPLPARLRFKLATSILREGGVENPVVHDVIEDLIKEEPEKARKLRNDVRVFLPKPDPKGVHVKTLSEFIYAFIAWGNRQRNLAESDLDRARQEQADKLVELMDAFAILLKSVHEEYIEFPILEAWISSLYAPTDYIQYEAQQHSRLVVEKPGALADVTDSLVWCSFYNYQALPLTYAFLSPSERGRLLEAGFALWQEEAEHRYRQAMLLKPFTETSDRLDLIAVDKVGVVEASKHPLLNRLESGLGDELDKITVKGDALVGCKGRLPMVDNYSPEDVTLQHPELIQWPHKESNTSLQSLFQHPLDYTLDHLTPFNGVSALNPSDVQTTRGVVAHGVIERIFGREPKRSIEDKLSAYDQVFDEVVNAQGILLLLSEHRVSTQLFKQQLLRCLMVLNEIIRANDLTVKGCEVELNGNIGLYNNGEVMTQAFIDMLLVDRNGQPVIFDFKWTEGWNKYKTKIEQNRALQLSIYQDLLQKSAHLGKARTAYFILPKGVLLTADGFAGEHVHVLRPELNGDLIAQAVNSYAYRREQINNGVIETSYEKPLEDIDYHRDMVAHQLFPMEVSNAELKKENYYSNYKCFNKVLQ